MTCRKRQRANDGKAAGGEQNSGRGLMRGIIVENIRGFEFKRARPGRPLYPSHSGQRALIRPGLPSGRLAVVEATRLKPVPHRRTHLLVGDVMSPHRLDT